jgi:hypothetical protein
MNHRLHSLCPYFAMFPPAFVREQLEAHSRPGDLTLDPYSGRGTALLEALLNDRRAIACDINPVAYCITAAKASVPPFTAVTNEIRHLKRGYLRLSPSALRRERRALPPFFHRAFHWTTLSQLLFLRRALRWRTNALHRFIAALALGSLHGEMDKSRSYFSNQMPRTISTKPRYSLKYWKRHRLWPKKRDAFAILESRAKFRLRDGNPARRGSVAMTDARRAAFALQQFKGQVKMVITSPPYLNITNYEEDQWLRLWFLGHDARPTYGQISRDDRHGGRERYWRFIAEGWRGIAPLLRNDARLVCRIGAKDIDVAEITAGLRGSIRAVFPKAYLIARPYRSVPKYPQTRAFRPTIAARTFEVDYAFYLGPRR